MTAINAIIIPERIARIANAVTTQSRPLLKQQCHPVGFANRLIFCAIDIL
jgi:hypothetical protein